MILSAKVSHDSAFFSVSIFLRQVASWSFLKRVRIASSMARAVMAEVTIPVFGISMLAGKSPTGVLIIGVSKWYAIDTTPLCVAER